MRLVWVVDAGLPTPLCNVAVFSRGGRLLGYPDLLDPVAGVGGEYDGEDHKDAVRHQADVAREVLLRDHGLEYFTVVGGDLREREMVVRRMHNARRRALFESAEERRWTLEPPAWFTVPECLDHYLARTGQSALLVRT